MISASDRWTSGGKLSQSGLQANVVSAFKQKATNQSQQKWTAIRIAGLERISAQKVALGWASRQRSYLRAQPLEVVAVDTSDADGEAVCASRTAVTADHGPAALRSER